MSFVTCPLGVAVDRARADEADEQYTSQMDALSRLQVMYARHSVPLYTT